MKNSRWQIVCLNDKTRREARERVLDGRIFIERRVRVREIERIECEEKEREGRLIRDIVLECSKTGCTEILLPYLIPLSLMSCKDFSTNTKIKKRMRARERGGREKERM